MAEDDNQRAKDTELLRMAVEIVSAYVGNNSVPTSQVPDVINTIYASLSNLDGAPTGGVAEPLKPAVPVRRSITPDYIVCLEDGKKLKMLKRHLRAVYGLSPEEYRARWGLPADYPMVAPNYAKQRSNFAKQIGLGRKKGETVRRRSSRP
ncbi:MAG: MucR family transcriptional regulator [Rhodospirillaceae bacterium]